MRFLCLQSCCGKRTLPLFVEFIDIQITCCFWNAHHEREEEWLGKCENVNMLGKKYLISKIIFEYIFIQIIINHITKLHIHLDDNLDPDINLDSSTCFLCERLSFFEPCLSVKWRQYIFLENVNHLSLTFFDVKRLITTKSIHTFNSIPIKIVVELFLEFGEIFSSSSRKVSR